MRSSTVFVLTFVISLTYVFTAPLEKRSADPDGQSAARGTRSSPSKGASGKFAKFADQYVKPIWLSNKGPKGNKKSGKNKKKKKNNNSGGSKKGSSNGKRNTRSRKTKKRNNNRNSQKRKHSKGFTLAFITTLGDAIGDFHEDGYLKDEMKIIMLWDYGDDVQIVLIHPVDSLTSNKLLKNHLIRQKRAYENQSTTSGLKPLKQHLITPNEDITEMDFYRNSKLDSILKKLNNDKLTGRNEFEKEKKIWASPEEENSMYSTENADTEMNDLRFKITGVTSNPESNMKKNLDGLKHNGNNINTKAGISPNEFIKNSPNFGTSGNDKISNINLEPNLKQSELINKGFSTNLKPLVKQNIMEYDKPGEINIENQPLKINSITIKNKINPKLENPVYEGELIGNKNVGGDLRNTPKQINADKTKNKVQPNAGTKLNDLSPESEEISEETPIFIDPQRNRIQKMFNNKNNLVKKIPNISGSLESIEPNDNKKQLGNNLQIKSKQLEKLLSNPQTQQFPDQVSKTANNSSLKNPKASNKKPEFDEMEGLINTSNSKNLKKPDEEAQNLSPETEELSLKNPFYKNIKNDNLQNKTKNTKLSNISESLESMNASENKKNPQIDSLQKTKNTEGVNEMLKKQSPKIVIKSKINEINGVPTKSSYVPTLNDNQGSSNNLKHFPDLNERDKSINRPTLTLERNPDTVLNDFSPIKKLAKGDQIFKNIESTPHNNIPTTSTIKSNKIPDSPLLTKSKLESPNSELNRANKDENYKPSNLIMNDIITSLPSEVDENDTSADKFFFDSIENFSDQLGGAILLTTGSFSSSKNPVKKESYKLDNTQKKNFENSSKSPTIEDFADGHDNINNDQNLGKSNTLKAILLETNNEDASGEIFNSDEDKLDGSVRKLSEPNDMPTSSQIFGDNTNGSKGKLNNVANNESNKLQESNNNIKHFKTKPQSKATLPYDNNFKTAKGQIPKSAEDKKHKIDSIDSPHDLYQIISLEDTSVFHPLKKISNNLWDSPVNKNFNLKNNKDEKLNSAEENKNVLEMITDEQFSSEKNIQKPENIFINENPKNDKPTIAEHFNRNTINSKNILLRQPNNDIEAMDGEVKTPAKDVHYMTDKPSSSSNQHRANQNLDPFDSLGGESFFHSMEDLKPDELQNAPKDFNLNINNNHNQKPIDNGYTSENVPTTNLNVAYDKSTNPIDYVENTIDNPHSLDDFNSNKSVDPFNSLEDKSLTSHEMLSDDSHSISKQDILKPNNIHINEQSKPTINENVNPNTINSKNILLRQPNNNIEAMDGEVKTPVKDVHYMTDKPSSSSNQHIENLNLDPFDSLGGESFFHSIENLQPDQLQNAPTNGNLVLNNNHIQKPIDNKYTSENLPKTNINDANNQSINPADDEKNTIDKPHSLDDINPNKSVNLFSSLEDRSLTSIEKLFEEPPSIPMTSNSFPNKNESKNHKNYDPKVLSDISSSVEASSSEIGKKIPDILNINKISKEKDSLEHETPHNFKSIAYNPDVSKKNQEYSSDDEISNQSNTKIPKFITSIPVQDNTEGSLSNESLSPNTFEDLIDEKPNTSEGNLSEINDWQTKQPIDKDGNESKKKTELNDSKQNLNQLSNESFGNVKNTSQAPKSEEPINSSLNTIASQIETPNDDNIQYTSGEPKSPVQHISNTIFDPFSSLGGESFFTPIKRLPSSKLQNSSKFENSVPINDHSSKPSIEDLTEDTIPNPKSDNNKLGLSNNYSNSVIDKTNNPSESAQNTTPRPQVQNKFTSLDQSHDTFKSLEDKSLTSFSDEILSEDPQNVPINEDLFLKNGQNQIPVTSEKTNVLQEIYPTEPSSSKINLNKSSIENLSNLSKSNVKVKPKFENELNPTVLTSIESNYLSTPSNTAVDGDGSKEIVNIMKDDLFKDFAERFPSSKSDDDKKNIFGLKNSNDSSKMESTNKPNKYPEVINKIINNTNKSNTIVEPQSHHDKSSGGKQKTITFSPNASNHQNTNIFKNPKTNKVTSKPDDKILTKNDSKIINNGVTDSVKSVLPLYEKSEPAVDLNRKNYDQSNDLSSNPFRTMYDYLLNDNKEGKPSESITGKNTPANSAGEGSKLADKFSNQLPNKENTQIKQNILENPTDQKMELPTHQIINNLQNSNQIHSIFNKGNSPSDIFTPSSITNPPENSNHLTNQDYNPYGFMIPKFSTKYEGGSSNYLWESIPPKQNTNLYSNNGFDNSNNILNRNKKTNENYGTYNKISSIDDDDNGELNKWNTNIKSNNEQNADGKPNINNNNEFLNEYLKNMTEKVLNRIDDIDDKIAKLNLLSNDNLGNENEKTDNLKTTNYVSTNINPMRSKNKNISLEPDSKLNETVESIEHVDESENDEGSKIRKHETILNKNKKSKKREKHKENSENTRVEKRRNNENKKDKYRKRHKNYSSIDSDEVVMDIVRRKHKKNRSSDSDDISLQHKDNHKRKNRKKIQKEIMYSSEEDSNVNYSSSNEITDSNYDSVADLKANYNSKKSKTSKNIKKSGKKPSHKSYSKHSNYSKDATKHKTKEKSLKNDSSYDKPMVSKKRHIKDHDENDDEIKESKKKKKRKKKKKKEIDTQTIDNGSDDNTSNGYEYITFYPEIQYTNLLSRYYG